MEAAAASARTIRVRGVTPGWATAALAFLGIAFVVGIVAGPVDIGVGDMLRSLGAKLGLPGVSTPLNEPPADANVRTVMGIGKTTLLVSLVSRVSLPMSARTRHSLHAGRPHRASGALAYHVLDLMHAFHDAAREGHHLELTSGVERPAPLGPDEIPALPS